MNSAVNRAIRKYLYDPEPRNEKPSEMIWCLGQKYTSQTTLHTSSEGQQAKPMSTWPVEFLDDFESRIWMTYRRGFTPIPRPLDGSVLPFSSASAAIQYAGQLITGQGKEGFSTDEGWGCMIRSAQSVLANALSTLHLGRDWRRTREDDLNMKEVEILSWFADHPEAPFSIHNFVRYGEISCATPAGQWFGPSAGSRCIQLVLQEFEPANLRVSVTGDQDGVYKDQVLQLSGDGPMKPTLLLIGKRLGHDNVNPLYYKSLKALLELPQSVGIAGGRPASAHYFCAYQGDYLFFLDPHHTQPALPLHDQLESYTSTDIDSFHTRRLRRIHLAEMDPSMLIAFLIRDHDDWLDWLDRIAEIQKSEPAVIHIFETAPPQTPQGEDLLDPLGDAAGLVALSDDEDS